MPAHAVVMTTPSQPVARRASSLFWVLNRMNCRNLALLVAVSAVSLFAGAQAYHLCATTGPCQRDSQVILGTNASCMYAAWVDKGVALGRTRQTLTHFWDTHFATDFADAGPRGGLPGVSGPGTHARYRPLSIFHVPGDPWMEPGTGSQGRQAAVRHRGILTEGARLV